MIRWICFCIIKSWAWCSAPLLMNAEPIEKLMHYEFPRNSHSHPQRRYSTYIYRTFQIVNRNVLRSRAFLGPTPPVSPRSYCHPPLQEAYSQKHLTDNTSSGQVSVILNIFGESHGQTRVVVNFLIIALHFSTSWGHGLNYRSTL